MTDWSCRSYAGSIVARSWLGSRALSPAPPINRGAGGEAEGHDPDLLELLRVVARPLQDIPGGKEQYDGRRGQVGHGKGGSKGAARYFSGTGFRSSGPQDEKGGHREA